MDISDLTSDPLTDRCVGALMGAFIGDALALGPHWYYDLSEQHKDFGTWITDYTTPKKGRYHEGLNAGDQSQAGYILKMLLQSLADKGEYSEADFCKRLDEDLFPQLDGKPMSGPGGYTSQSVRKAWHIRVQQGKGWDETGNDADTTEAIERTLALAVRYALDPEKLADTVVSNTVLTQNDGLVVSMTVAFNAVLGYLVEGNKLDTTTSDALMARVRAGTLPFHVVTSENHGVPDKEKAESTEAGTFASPDALLSPSYMATAAADPNIQIEPAWKVSQVYGMPCAIYHQLPAAYYLAARFTDDFESAVLHAVNGGGQNQARAILTGALVGAQTGLAGIPERFINGLSEKQSLLPLCAQIASQVKGSAR